MTVPGLRRRRRAGAAGRSGDPAVAATTPPGADGDVEVSRAGRVADTVARLFPGAVGAFAAAQTPELGIGTLSAPRPGLWPLVLSVLLMLASAVMVVAGDRLQRGEAFRRGTFQVLAGAATVGAFALLIEQVGFELPALALMVLWLRVLGGETWRATVLISVSTVAAFYLLFVVGLGASVPHLLSF